MPFRRNNTPPPEIRKIIEDYMRDAGTVLGENRVTWEHVNHALANGLASQMAEKARLVRFVEDKTTPPKKLPMVLDDYSVKKCHGRLNRLPGLSIHNFRAGADVLVSINGKSFYVRLTEDIDCGTALGKVTKLREGLDLKMGQVFKVHFKNAVSIHDFRKEKKHG